MKKYIAIVLVVVMLIPLIACNADEKKPDEQSAAPGTLDFDGYEFVIKGPYGPEIGRASCRERV